MLLGYVRLQLFRDYNYNNYTKCTKFFRRYVCYVTQLILQFLMKCATCVRFDQTGARNTGNAEYRRPKANGLFLVLCIYLFICISASTYYAV